MALKSLGDLTGSRGQARRRSYRPYHYFHPRLLDGASEGVRPRELYAKYTGDSLARPVKEAGESSDGRAFTRSYPRHIAAWLVREHGLEEARRIALLSSLQAQQQGDNYVLSVWREIKRILAERTESETERLV